MQLVDYLLCKIITEYSSKLTLEESQLQLKVTSHLLTHFHGTLHLFFKQNKRNSLTQCLNILAILFILLKLKTNKT